MVIKVILPRRAVFDRKKLEGVIESTLSGLALGAKADFETTVATWNTSVDFTIKSPEKYSRVVSTNNRIYKFINDGTRVRYAVMTANFRAKTRPGFIGSNAGAGGVAFFSKKRPRPGIKARNFDKKIAEKWRKEAPRTMQRAIDAAFGG